MKETLERIYNSKHKDRLEIMFYYIESSLSNHDLNTVNKFLKSIDKDKLEYIDLIAILRITYRVKNLLSHWRSFYKDTLKILKKRKINHNKLLRGLE